MHAQRIEHAPPELRPALADAFDQARCWWCDAPADRVCDSSLSADGTGAWFHTTCDAQLCERCTHALPLLCGPAGVEAADECPYCHDLHAEGWAPWEHDGASMPADHPSLHRQRARAHAQDRRRRDA